MESPLFPTALPTTGSGDFLGWNPGGPEGQLVDPSLSYANGHPTTVGETLGTAQAPVGGWTLGWVGGSPVAIPASPNPSQPPPGWRPPSQPSTRIRPRYPTSYAPGSSRGEISARPASSPTSKATSVRRPQPAERTSAVRSRDQTQGVAYNRVVRQASASSNARPGRFSNQRNRCCPYSDKRIFLLGIGMLIIGIVGFLIGYRWGESYPADQPYSTLAGYMLLVCPVLGLVGFATVVCNRPLKCKYCKLLDRFPDFFEAGEIKRDHVDVVGKDGGVGCG